MSWFSPCSWTWPRESISDDAGSADVAYVSLFALLGGSLFAMIFMCVMSAVSYFRCASFTLANGVIVNCTYDPLPLGQGIGLVWTAFAAALGALVGYMVATRRQPRPAAPAAPAPTTTTTTTETTTGGAAPVAAEAATDEAALRGKAPKGKR